MIYSERVRETSVIHVDEDLDVASCDALGRQIRAAEKPDPDRIVVSLENCDYCDSSGLGMLLTARKRLGARFLVVLPDVSRCRRAFEITGVATLDMIVSTLDRALAPDA